MGASTNARSVNYGTVSNIGDPITMRTHLQELEVINLQTF